MNTYSPESPRTQDSHTTPNRETHPTADKVVNKAHETVDRFSDSAARAEEKVRESVSGASEKIRKTADKAQERGTETVAGMKDYVNKNPLASVGIAFAVGMLFSGLLRK